MVNKARYRSSGIGVVALMMLLSYQNCGPAVSPQNTGSADSSVHMAPSTQDPAEVAILSQVLNSYSSCDQIADDATRSACETSALQDNSGAGSLAQAKTVNASGSVFCYVVGPKCSLDTDPTTTPVMMLQSCRTSLVTHQTYSFESLNSYMQSDPIRYAQMINDACLYRSKHCVVAVRCVNPNALSN